MPDAIIEQKHLSKTLLQLQAYLTAISQDSASDALVGWKSMGLGAQHAHQGCNKQQS